MTRPCSAAAALGLAFLSCTRHAPVERAGEVHDASSPSVEVADAEAGEDARPDAGLHAADRKSVV